MSYFFANMTVRMPLQDTNNTAPISFTALATMTGTRRTFSFGLRQYNV